MPIQKFLKIRGILRNLLLKESKTERISAESHFLIENDWVNMPGNLSGRRRELPE